MLTSREPVRFLSPDDMETVHRNALRILAEIGMKIDHDEALEYLASAQCKVDRAGAERVSLLGARVQMISEYYGCPSGVHGGKTDACAPGVRCGVEKGVSMLMPVLCGAVGFGTVGHIDAVTFSPEQLVIDNEIARYVRRAVQGFEVADETINVDLIRRVGVGGEYLSQADTAQRFREVLDLSPFFTVRPWGAGERVDEARRWENMARDRARELLANEVPSPLSDDQARAVDEIVREAESALRRQGAL